MVAKRATLALLVVWALSLVSASPAEDLGLFTVQDSNFYALALDAASICTDTEFVNSPDGNPEVRLDEGLLVGYRKAQVDHFLGIPFALPPWAIPSSLSNVMLIQLCMPQDRRLAFTPATAHPALCGHSLRSGVRKILSAASHHSSKRDEPAIGQRRWRDCGSSI